MFRIAIIIVSYNVCSLLRQCLASIAAHGGGVGYAVETLVVDNQSGDGSAAMVAAEFPEVRLLTPPANLGFTGANNLALRALGFDAALPAGEHTPDFVLLLNPDAELTPGALPQMVAFMAGQPQAGACGPQLRYGDGRFQHGAFRFPGLGQVALDVLPLEGLPGLHRLLDGRANGRYAAAQWQGAAPFPVDFVLGAALFARGAAVAQVGGLDDGYWMYCEEMDWCMRLRERGWQVMALPAAAVIHHAGQSSRQRRWAAFVQLWRSRYRFFTIHRRRYGPGFLTVMRGLVRTGMALQARRARAEFAAGRITGGELAAALDAYAAVARL